MKNNMTLKSILETILFVRGEPMALKKLASAARASEEEVKAALEELKRDCESRGVTIVHKDGAYQMCSHPENARYIDDVVKGEFSEDLSRASLETAAIIAYQGPVSRAEIDHIRGVHSSYAVRILLLRGLVDWEESPGDARTHLYRISINFLKHLGLTAVEDLPGYKELKDLSAAAVGEMRPLQTPVS